MASLVAEDDEVLPADEDLAGLRTHLRLVPLPVDDDGVGLETQATYQRRARSCGKTACSREDGGGAEDEVVHRVRPTDRASAKGPPCPAADRVNDEGA